MKKKPVKNIRKPLAVFINEWHKEPVSKKHIAELRCKLALARGFILQLQTVIKGISLPETLKLSTQDGEFEIDLEAIEKLLKETSDS